MKISINSAQNIFNNHFKISSGLHCRGNNLRPLACDTVSFGAMKKREFSGIDLLVINKFKAPVEKFNTNEDFRKWCKTKLEREYLNKDYRGKQFETTQERKRMLSEWFNYYLKENTAYTPAIQLLITDGITADLRADNDHLPPVLNKGILADTIAQLQEKGDKQTSFIKLYKLNLQTHFTTDINHDNGNYTGWIVIPGKKNDPENFDENVEKLKTLSHHNWCTKSFNAEPYLEKGDFHIYMENGSPKLGIRFKKDEIFEIQGERNNGKIPLKYLNTAREHSANFKINKFAKSEFMQSEQIEAKTKEFENRIGKPLEKASTEELLQAAGIQVQKDSADGLLIIDEYKQPDKDFSWEDLKINENKLFKDIKEIKRNFRPADSHLTNLGSLKKIGGYAEFRHSLVTSLGNLEEIGDYADFCESRITDIGNLKRIGDYANFGNTKISSLRHLKEIGGNAYFQNSNITSLGELEEIGGMVDFEGTNIEDLGNLKTIEGSAFFKKSKITSLGKLEFIGGNATFTWSQISDLGNLKFVGGRCIIYSNSKITTEMCWQRGFRVS